MPDKTLEERIDALETVSHIHDTNWVLHGGLGNVDCNPEKAEPVREKLQMSKEDTEKAKKKGSLHGDPIFIVE